MIGKAAGVSDFFDGEEEILQKITDTMFELPNGTVISTVELVNKTFGEDHGFSIDQLFLLAIDLPPFARKAGIRLGNPYKGQVEIGLPFVGEMIILHGKSRKS